VFSTGYATGSVFAVIRVKPRKYENLEASR
jgi:hypothetical protein